MIRSNRSSSAGFVHPPEPPFEPVVPPTPVENPVDAALEQLVHFFVTFRAGAGEISE